MRILMVTNTYAPARNGVAGWVSMSVRELREAGHEVDVLTYAHERREPGLAGVIEVPAWAGLDRDFRVAPVLSGLPRAATERAYDVVHVHHPILLGKAGAELGERTGAAVAFTCHSVYTDYLEEYYWGVGRVLEPRVRRMCAAFADGCDVVFAPSARAASWVRDCGATCRIERVDPPADTVRIRSMPRDRARSALGLAVDRPLAFYVGRVADEKRVGDLVREFERTLVEVPDALLAIGGTGRRVPAIARYIRRRGLGDSVRLLGPLDGDQLGAWYSAADTAVSASRREAGPLVVVEAMACACPVVALRAPGFVDRLVDEVNGLLVDDVEGAIGDGIARILLDPELRQRLADGARERAPLYTPRAVTDRQTRVYEEIRALADARRLRPASAPTHRAAAHLGEEA